MTSGTQNRAPADAAPDARGIQEELARVFRSSVFRRSEQQRALLSYLAERSVEGHADGLKEYSVGVDALGKREDYDPRKDATVRIQIGKLRSKLDEYFRTEGVDDPIIFNLPKGGFRVFFHVRTQEELDGEGTPGNSRIAAQARRMRRLSAGLLGLLVVCGAVIALLLVAQSRTRSSAELSARLWTPALESIWRPFLDDGRSLTLSIGTPVFANFDGLSVRDASLNAWPEGPLTPPLELIRRALNASDVHPTYGYNGFGETVGALRLYRLFLVRGKDVNFRRSNGLSWDDFRERNLILLGSPKSVTHLKYFRELHTKLAFDVQEDRIMNFNPRAGELPFYRKLDSTTGGASNRYALVTRLPGVDGSGNLMILGSPDTDGTQAACEYVTNSSTAVELIRLFGSNEALPPAYQVLLRITWRGEVPLVITAIAHRELTSQ